MIIKNISAVRRTFGLGDSLTVSLAVNETTTVPDSAEVQAKVQAFVERGFLQVTTAPATFIPVIKHPKSVLATVASGAAAGTVVLGGVTLTLAGASATLLAADLVSKINANTTLQALGVYAHAAVVGASSGRIVAIEVADSQDISPVSDFIAVGTATGITFSVATAAVVSSAGLQIAASSFVATGTGLQIVTGLKSIVSYQLTVVSAGVLKAITSTIEVVGGVISLSNNAGGSAVNLANGDVVNVLAYGRR